MGVTVVSGLAMFNRDGAGRVLEILGSGVYLITSIGLKVLSAVLLAAWLRLLLPKDKISKHFGGHHGLKACR
ncbi:hypothetical protein [Labrenzia sp. CE80]|uniref:hypothetical protein n=1 Tax=Labrenzia sp. CE80 TaxID=1788986 RepID=UPI00129B00C9|nr:hypothetical protein [Labrenzia sp. CE80]